MQLLTIELEGFKSFQEYQEFSFDLDSGLYFVTGENKVETNLGANGAGKSALFEAICWCLYGKTSTSLKAGNVVNWNDKGCRVGLVFDGMIQIIRTQSPNILQLNGNPVTQDELEKYLNNLGFESFLYSTFISQFSSKFFDLSPADKMVVFSDIMSEALQPWLLRSEQAKAKANYVSNEIGKLERTISMLNGRVSQLESQDYSQQIKEFEKNKKQQLIEAKARLEELLKRENTAKNNLQVNMQEKAKLQVTKKSNIKPGTLEKLKDNYSDHVNSRAESRANLQSLERGMKEVEGISGKSVCPTCFQDVDKKLLKNKIKSMLAGMDHWRVKEEEHKKIAQAIFEEIRVEEIQIEKEREQESETKARIRGLETSIKGLSDTIKYTAAEITQTEKSIVAINKQENQYAQMEKERQADLNKFKAAVKDNEDLLGEAKKEFDAYAYWVKGFKEIRLLLMIDALKEFEISINNNLSKFGMGDWNVKLDIDQENKSGTIRKGFSVLVESPNHNGFVPFEVWSGGEGQRLRLAGTVGLMDLIQGKRQVDFGIEIFDEPTAWLSDKGIDDLCQALYYRAKELDKKIFLIDHKNLNTFGGFHGTINIVKDEKGSHVY